MNDQIFNVMVIIVLVLNVLWYSAKKLIRKNGLKADWLWNHSRDFKSLYTLWKGDFPTKVQTRAKLHLLLLVFGVFLMFAFFIGMVTLSP